MSTLKLTFTLEPGPNHDGRTYPTLVVPEVPEEQAKNILEDVNRYSSSDRYYSFDGSESGIPRDFYINTSRVVAVQIGKD